MVNTDDHKKYVTIENVRAFYRAKDDTIHLTSTDSDVQAGGFHLSLNKGTQTENTIREILTEQGVIRNSNTFIPAAVTPKPDSALNTHRTDGGAKVISIVSAGGGSGKTNVALSLATQLAEPTKYGQLKVIVVDLDLRDGQISYYIQQTSPTMLNFFVETNKNLENLRKSITTVPQAGIDVLLAPKRARNADYLEVGFFKSILDILRENYDVIILDTPTIRAEVYNDADTILGLKLSADEELFKNFIYRESDALIYNMNLTERHLYSLLRWSYDMKNASSMSKETNVHASQIGIIVNQIHAKTPADWEVIKKATNGFPILTAIPWESDLSGSNSLLKIQGMLQTNSPYAKAIKQLAKQVY